MIEDGKDIVDEKGVAYEVLKKARMYGTKLVSQQDGEVLKETPDEFEKRLSEDQNSKN